jgi:hypothetical protein
MLHVVVYIYKLVGFRNFRRIQKLPPPHKGEFRKVALIFYVAVAQVTVFFSRATDSDLRASSEDS